MYGMDIDTVNWIKDYLLARTQLVAIGASESIMKPVLAGVPQGSIFGDPILYNIYINDLPEISKELTHVKRKSTTLEETCSLDLATNVETQLYSRMTQC